MRLYCITTKCVAILQDVSDERVAQLLTVLFLAAAAGCAARFRVRLRMHPCLLVVMFGLVTYPAALRLVRRKHEQLACAGCDGVIIDVDCAHKWRYSPCHRVKDCLLPVHAALRQLRESLLNHRSSTPPPCVTAERRALADFVPVFLGPTSSYYRWQERTDECVAYTHRRPLERSWRTPDPVSDTRANNQFHPAAMRALHADVERLVGPAPPPLQRHVVLIARPLTDTRSLDAPSRQRLRAAIRARTGRRVELYVGDEGVARTLAL